MRDKERSRRQFLRAAMAGGGAFLLAACDRVGSSAWFRPLLQGGEALSLRAQRLLLPRASMAQEFSEADLSPRFRSNGNSRPDNPYYQELARHAFRDWALQVDGLVQTLRSFSLAELRAMPARTQITRHDCVEGWSAIGKWTGVPLARVLDAVQPLAQARYVVFHCADPMEEGGREPYYESIDMDDAWHPQTLLAYALNDRELPMANGAPLRLRVERQLGYKHAKYLLRIELVPRLDGIRGGRGGYWEDSNGYQWYAGI